jgi:hypothetical protein
MAETDFIDKPLNITGLSVPESKNQQGCFE